MTNKKTTSKKRNQHLKKPQTRKDSDKDSGKSQDKDKEAVKYKDKKQKEIKRAKVTHMPLPHRISKLEKPNLKR
jgi:hypothetical protein